jgi:hypothetical protein
MKIDMFWLSVGVAAVSVITAFFLRARREPDYWMKGHTHGWRITK